jgi:predicted nucleic acid-binding protein
MKILIDTNVLISAILKDGQPENAILWIIKHIEWEWLASPDIMLEY